MIEQDLNPSSGNIIVVDDTPANLRLLTKLLTHTGYHVRPTRDGRMALNAAQSNPPDLIMLDIMMPDMDGYEVCRQLKADERTRDIPVIFISALDDVHDKVKSFTVGGVDYVTKPFQTEEVLARVRAHLTNHQLKRRLHEQISELDAFAHTVAHDLKSPLTYITGMTDLILQQYGRDLPKQVQELIQKVQNSGYRSANIIDELLLLSSVRKQAISVRPLDMQRIVSQAQERIEFMVDEYGGTVELPEEWPTAVGYAPWIIEIWVNYLSNGLKYGGRPPSLQLGATRQPDNMIRFWVRDNGAGLSHEKQAVLFTEFVRLNEINVEGYGLGLSIVQRIISKLDGRAGVNSQLGKGSEFYFELPAG